MAVAALPVLAGSGPSEDEGPDIELLRRLHLTEQEEVRLVEVPAVVTNRRGRIVRGLEKGDFRLYEDYVPQEIKFLWTETDQPVSIAFLLDVSGSMRQAGKLDEAKEAIRVFADGLRGDDQIGLVCFADEQVAWVTDFTSDRHNFVRRLDVQQGYGQTALYDALAAAPRLVDEQVGGSKAIVLFTDGVDTASKMSTFEALGLSRSVNVPIYAVGFTTFASRLLPKGTTPPEHRTVAMFAEETGGRLFLVLDPDDLKEAVLAIQRELRFRYVIGYRPSRSLWDGSFRRIKLEMVRSGLDVRARTGYYAEP
jgi:Ca-activated chloride channel family protein